MSAIEQEVDTGTDELICTLRNAVATISFNRPASKNSLSDTLTPALRRMVRYCADTNEIRAVLITGVGTAFCAGGDVKGMGGSRSSASLSHSERVARLIERQRTLTGALYNLPKPTIAALPGPAVGAGLSIALACDIRIASETAFVSTGYSRIGLSGDYGIGWLLTRIVGTARARGMMYFSERIDATGCEAMGLFSRVVPDDQLRAIAFGMAETLASGPSLALGLMKRGLNEALSTDFMSSLDAEAERLVQSSASDQHREAVRAFVEKRKPTFYP
jgi:enoyl-CoA hydratase/carnithine racemase